MVASKPKRRSSARPDWPGGERPLLIAVCAALIALSGCTAIPEMSPLEPVSADVPPRLEVLPRPAPPPVAQESTARAQAPVAIVVSSNLPAYMDVAHSLAALLPADDYFVHVLAESAQAPPSAAEVFGSGAQRARAVVAIGLPAALYARANSDAPLIFCQVLNYADYPELQQAAAGVSMLPAFDEQLAFWKAVDSSLKVVGTIAGPGHEALIEKSSSAAADQGIRLESRIVTSDRETVWQFKRLSAEIDGFWLFPDNRVLSIGAIEELMAYAASRRLPVVVSTPELLRFGALMSLAPSPAQVADSILAVLGSLPKFLADGFAIVAPSGFEVDVNPAVASRLGIGVD